MLINAFISLALKVVGAFSGIALTYFITNTYSKHDAGQFFQHIMLIGFFGTILTCGLPVLLLRDVSKYYKSGKWGNINNDLSLIVLFLPLIITLVISLLHPVFMYIFNMKIYDTFVLCLGLIGFAIIQCLSASFQALHEFKKTVLFQNILIPVIFLLITIFYVSVFPAGGHFYIELYSLSVCVVAIISVFIWFGKEGAYFCRKRLVIREEVSQSIFSVFIATLMIQVIQWSAQLNVSMLMSSEELALFSTAQRVSLLASFIMVAVNVVVIPRLSVAFNNGEYRRMNQFASYACLINIFLGLPLIVFVFVFSKEIMLFFGEGYSEAALLLLIMTIGQFVNLITGPVADLLNMTKHEKVVRNILIISGMMSIFFSYYLTSRYGLAGAATSVALVVAFQNAALSIAAYKRCGFNLFHIFKFTKEVRV